MSSILALSALLLIGSLASVEGLTCNEGFNVSLSGIPLYHWTERTCDANSKCFGQELEAKLSGLLVRMRYGACLSSAYADYLDCDNLFGPDSTFDPAKLLDLIPDIEKQINATVHLFISDAIGQIKELLSNGNSIDEFVSGMVKFFENMGFNMEKFAPLQPSIGKIFTALFNTSDTTGAGIQAAVGEFFTALGNLDTVNTEFADSIYKFIGNFLNDTQLQTEVKDNVLYKTLIEKVPGLVKSMLPANWNTTLWYDVTFKLLADINIADPKQSTIDAIATIKSTYTIPADVLQIIDPIFNSLPDLVDQLATKSNFTYPGYWSLELLKVYSERNDATKAFDVALINFVEKTANTTLQAEYVTMIQWLPGLFYKFFPADKTVIEDVYMKMAAGFNSFNFANLSVTAAPTKLSDLIVDLITKISGTDPGVTEKAYIVNFSKMFYNLLSDYNTQLDTFFQVLIDGFQTFPTINAGEIITNLTVAMGGVVPPEVKPLLDNIQTIIDAATQPPFNASNLYDAFTTVIDAYKTAFPTSEIPALVQQYISLIRQQVELPFPNWTSGTTQEEYNQKIQEYMAKMTELNLEMTYWQIDFQFAIFKLTSKDPITQAAIDAFPQYGTYIRLMEALDPVDLKQLIKDVVGWIAQGATTSTPLTATSFVAATKTTIGTITAKLTNVTKELRNMFAPDSCKFATCDTDLCNNHEYIDNQTSVTKAPAPSTPNPSSTTAAPITTTSGSDKISFSFLLQVATMWMACKTLMG